MLKVPCLETGGVSESVTWTVKFGETPATVGVPLTLPLEFNVSPAGSVVPFTSDQVTGAAPPEPSPDFSHGLSFE